MSEAIEDIPKRRRGVSFTTITAKLLLKTGALVEPETGRVRGAGLEGSQRATTPAETEPRSPTRKAPSTSLSPENPTVTRLGSTSLSPETPTVTRSGSTTAAEDVQKRAAQAPPRAYPTATPLTASDPIYWKYHVLHYGKDLYLTTNPGLSHVYCRNAPGYYVEVFLPSPDPLARPVRPSRAGYRMIFRDMEKDTVVLTVTRTASVSGGELQFSAPPFDRFVDLSANGAIKSIRDIEKKVNGEGHAADWEVMEEAKEEEEKAAAEKVLMRTPLEPSLEPSLETSLETSMKISVKTPLEKPSLDKATETVLAPTAEMHVIAEAMSTKEEVAYTASGEGIATGANTTPDLETGTHHTQPEDMLVVGTVMETTREPHNPPVETTRGKSYASDTQDPVPATPAFSGTKLPAALRACRSISRRPPPAPCATPRRPFHATATPVPITDAFLQKYMEYHAHENHHDAVTLPNYHLPLSAQTPWHIGARPEFSHSSVKKLIHDEPLEQLKMTNEGYVYFYTPEPRLSRINFKMAVENYANPDEPGFVGFAGSEGPVSGGAGNFARLVEVLGAFRPCERNFGSKLRQRYENMLRTDEDKYVSGGDVGVQGEGAVMKYFRLADGITSASPADDDPGRGKLGWVTVFGNDVLKEVGMFEVVLGSLVVVGYERWLDQTHTAESRS